jgi:hypothetical protein
MNLLISLLKMISLNVLTNSVGFCPNSNTPCFCCRNRCLILNCRSYWIVVPQKFLCNCIFRFRLLLHFHSSIPPLNHPPRNPLHHSAAVLITLLEVHKTRISTTWWPWWYASHKLIRNSGQCS